MTTTIIYKHGNRIIQRGDAKIAQMVRTLKLKNLKIVVQMSESAYRNAHSSQGWYRAGYFDANKSLIFVIGYNQTTRAILSVVAHELGHAHHYQHMLADFRKSSHVQRENYAHKIQTDLGYPPKVFNRAYYARRDKREKNARLHKR